MLMKTAQIELIDLFVQATVTFNLKLLYQVIKDDLKKALKKIKNIKRKAQG
jgi:hypothetical protein